MARKIYKYFFYFTVSLFFFFLTYITFNSNFRTTAIHYLINSYKVYMIVSVQPYLKRNNPDFSSAKKKLLGFINFSKKISNGKNKLLIGIYDSANLVQSNIINDEDFGIFEEVFSEIVNLDPILYEARVWYARSLYANNKTQEAFDQLNKAIEISPLDSHPFRLAIKIASEQKKFDLMYSYCNKYLQSEFGGKQKRYEATVFSGFNINKFGVSFNLTNKKSEQIIYTFSGINLGKLDSYEIIPEKSKNFNSLNLLFTFIPGTSLEIKNVIIQTGNKTHIINQEDIIITANNSFFLKKEFENLIVFTNENDEIINLKFKQEYQNVDKILIEMKIKKLNISNLNCEIK